VTCTRRVQFCRDRDRAHLFEHNDFDRKHAAPAVRYAPPKASTTLKLWKGKYDRHRTRIMYARAGACSFHVQHWQQDPTSHSLTTSLRVPRSMAHTSRRCYTGHALALQAACRRGGIAARAASAR